MGEQDNPADSTDYTVPTVPGVATTGYAEGSLYDYFGIPTGVPDLEHNNLHARAYNLIYNQWFRDENLQDSVVVDLDDGPDDPADYVVLRRGKRHDYFTSCLPWPQKINDGSTLNVPLGGTAPVIGDGSGMRWTGGASGAVVQTTWATGGDITAAAISGTSFDGEVLYPGGS